VSGRWLLLRRLDALWAVPSGAVQAVRPGPRGTLVTLRSSRSLQADEVLTMAPELSLRALPTCLDPQPLAGLAVWRGQPVLCVDPALPPPLLLPPTGEEADARQH
jgi:hypothetical protein